MQLFRLCHTSLLLTCMTIFQASAQDLAECPNPLFECIGPGSGGSPPGNPPDPIFKPVAPFTDSYVDFNRSFGVIRNGALIVSPGSPEIQTDLADFLTRNRTLIDPNTAYLLSPGSVIDADAAIDGLIVGGGALTQ